MIPEDWELLSIGSMGEVVAGKALAAKAPGLQRPYLRTKNVFDGRIDINDVLSMPMTDAEFARYELRDGDVLLNEGQTLELVGRCSIYQGEFPEPCAIQNQLIRFRARSGVSPTFAAHLFRYCQKTGVFARIALQTTSVAHLGVSRFQKLTLAWPVSETEQRAIAAALSDVDALISALDRLISKKRAVKTAAMQQLLTGKQRLPGFSGEWETRRLGDMGTFSKGHGLSKNELDTSGVLPAIPYTAIYTDFDEIIKPWQIDNFVADTSTAVVIHSPHLLIAGSSNMLENIGKAAAFTGNRETAIGGDIILYKTAANVAFLSYLLNTRSHRERIISLAQGSTICHVYAATFKDYEIPLPSVAEQTAIAAVLADMDAEISALEARREKTRRIKHGMMQELLTGRTRLGNEGESE
ncbi:MAG: restriction endonuclease subunit S [Rubrobacteraceae bacterium]